MDIPHNTNNNNNKSKNKMGKIENYINERAEKEGIVFFGLIDPPTQHVDLALKYAKAFNEANADIILIGGSIGWGFGDLLDNLIRDIKSFSSIPVMLFPGNINGVSKEADAIYFMSLLNSANPYWITGAQALAAPHVLQYGIESIPTSLIVIEPGESVGWIGEARAIPYNKPDLITAYALAGKLMGQRITILERGSGAPGPASPETFRAVKKAVKHPVICAGSSKNLKDIEETIKAGADGIHIATLVQKAEDPFKEAKKVVDFAKKCGKSKLKSFQN